MDVIRAKSSNLQGALSGKLRRRIDVMKSVVSVLSGRAEDVGATSHLNSKNVELELRVREQSKEIAILNEGLSKSENKIISLEAEIRSFKERIGSSVSPEPLRSPARSGGDLGGFKSHGGGGSPRDMSRRIARAVNEELELKLGVFRAREDKLMGLMEDILRMKSDLMGLKKEGACPSAEERNIPEGEAVFRWKLSQD